jgi:hypothetical protein
VDNITHKRVVSGLKVVSRVTVEPPVLGACDNSLFDKLVAKFGKGHVEEVPNHKLSHETFSGANDDGGWKSEARGEDVRIQAMNEATRKVLFLNIIGGDAVVATLPQLNLVLDVASLQPSGVKI